MIGLIPCAGKASRIQGLPKWMLPIPDSFLLQRHIHHMENSDCKAVYIGANQENYNLILNYIPSGRVYLAQFHDTMTQTVISSHLSMDDENCIFGLADSYIEDEQCYAKLATALADCDVAVGVFHVSLKQANKLGMVEFNYRDMKVLNVIDKPQVTDLMHAWGALAWRPSFWQHLKPDMPHVGYALMPAIEAGLDVRAVVMQGQYFDAGTPSEYFDLICYLHKCQGG